MYFAPFQNRFTVPPWAIDPTSRQYQYRCETLNIRENSKNGNLIRTISFCPEYPYLIFGRDPGAVHIFVGHESVSSQHAALVWSIEGRVPTCYLLNLESRSGVLLNGNHVEPGNRAQVFPNDIMVLGKAPHVFQLCWKIGSVASSTTRPQIPADIPARIPGQSPGEYSSPVPTRSEAAIERPETRSGTVPVGVRPGSPSRPSAPSPHVFHSPKPVHLNPTQSPSFRGDQFSRRSSMDSDPRRRKDRTDSGGESLPIPRSAPGQSASSIESQARNTIDQRQGNSPRYGSAPLRQPHAPIQTYSEEHSTQPRGPSDWSSAGPRRSWDGQRGGYRERRNSDSWEQRGYNKSWRGGR